MFMRNVTSLRSKICSGTVRNRLVHRFLLFYEVDGEFNRIIHVRRETEHRMSLHGNYIQFIMTSSQQRALQQIYTISDNDNV